MGIAEFGLVFPAFPLDGYLSLAVVGVVCDVMRVGGVVGCVGGKFPTICAPVAGKSGALCVL